MGNVGAFAEQTFALRGEPTAISDSAQVWARFSDTTDTTAGDLRALDAEDFQGDEADTYRGRLNGDLPPYLDTASQAWNIVGGALRNYAAALADLQSQMSSLRSTAWSQWQSASVADADACQAEADDQAHTADRQHRADALKPGQKLPAATYRPAGGAARSTAASTSADYTATLTAADRLRSQHTQAVNACADAIDRATALRFADPPSWLGHLWEKACDWVADHLDILQTLSTVLKQISSIAATLAMIPILAPLAGPVAAGAGMLALGIDTGIKITTGHGNWTDIALTGMSFIPGAKAAVATDLLSTGNDAAHGDLDWTQLAATAAFGAAGRRRHFTSAATDGPEHGIARQGADAPRPAGPNLAGADVDDASAPTGLPATERATIAPAATTGTAADRAASSAGVGKVESADGAGRRRSEPTENEPQVALPMRAHSFSSDQDLQDHFERHGRQFDARTPTEYARLAEEFRDRGLAGSLPVKDAAEVFKVWDQDTHNFGVYDNDSHSTYTFFRARSATYFDRQEGVLRWSGED